MFYLEAVVFHFISIILSETRTIFDTHFQQFSNPTNISTAFKSVKTAQLRIQMVLNAISLSKTMHGPIYDNRIFRFFHVNNGR